MHKIPTTHDASSLFIFPDGNGDSSDNSSIIFGDGQPHAAPYTKGKMLTILFKKKIVKKRTRKSFETDFYLPTSAAKYWCKFESFSVMFVWTFKYSSFINTN